MTRVLAVIAAILVPAALILWLGHLAAGLIVGGIALAVICWYGYRAWTADRERRRRYRETVWARRECEGWEQHLQGRIEARHEWLYQLPHPIEDRTHP